MRTRTLLATLLAAALTGCTHQQLERSTVLTTGTVMEIQYRIVLRNLAKLSCQPTALPDHMDLADGVVQVNDRLGLGQSGGFTNFQYGFGLDQFGPSAQRQVTEQWGADATTDPQRLVDLQDLYRVALGLPPLPPPQAITYLRQQQAEERAFRGLRRGRHSERRGEEKDGPAGGPSDSPQVRILPPTYQTAAGGAPSTANLGGGGNTPAFGGGESAGGNDSRRVPIEILLRDVPPPGWFHIGCKKDVPKDACYVGCYGDRCAWVMCDGIEALSRFTVTVLNVVKLQPGEGGGRTRGVAVTGGN